MGERVKTITKLKTNKICAVGTRQSMSPIKAYLFLFLFNNGQIDFGWTELFSQLNSFLLFLILLTVISYSINLTNNLLNNNYYVKLQNFNIY